MIKILNKIRTLAKHISWDCKLNFADRKCNSNEIKITVDMSIKILYGSCMQSLYLLS